MIVTQPKLFEKLPYLYGIFGFFKKLKQHKNKVIFEI